MNGKYKQIIAVIKVSKRNRLKLLTFNLSRQIYHAQAIFTIFLYVWFWIYPAARAVA